MGKALYRKYRSKKLSEIVGQEHITDTLSRALEKGLLSHAYLLTGPRGVGKTSIARILAYEINGLPYDDEGTHLDIIEIDAASNRRIDEIRELNDRIHIAPTSARYKVYIIDEVHMLTKEAFNALLKTLEEPPEHAVFILATTEAHKVPETIISRTQRFTFKPVETAKVIAHLKQISNSEKINIDDSALQLIAEHGEGSFRDSISLLDQVRHMKEGKISLQDVQRAIGQAPAELMSELIDALTAQDMAAITDLLAKLKDQGMQAPQVARQVASVVRQDMLSADPRIPRSTAIRLLRQLLTVSGSRDSGLSLELALYDCVIEQAFEAVNQQPKTVERPKRADKAQTSSKPDDHNEPVEAAAQPDESTETIMRPGQQALDETIWPDVLAAVKARHNTLYGIARMAVPSFEPDRLVLTFAFPFHQKRISDTKNRQLISDIISDVVGKTIEIEVTVDPSAKRPILSEPEMAEEPEDIDLKNISNIFGGAEIVN